MPTNISSTENRTYIHDRTVETVPWRNSFLYFTMNPNDEYDDYSALDAPTHLSHVLKHFFEQKRNAYKYALAKQHYDEIVRDDNFATATRLFKIITGTNLVTNKHVLHYRTAQGMRYLVKKQYAQSSQRDHRTARRMNAKDHTAPIDTSKTPTTTPSPFVQMMASKFDDSSDDDDDTTTQSRTSNEVQLQSKPGVEEAKSEPIDHINTEICDDDETPSVDSELTKHAEALEKDMQSAMANLEDPEYTPDNTNDTKMDALIHQAIKASVEPLTDKIQMMEQNMNTMTRQFETLQMANTTSKNQVTILQQDYERLNRQLNFVSRALETLEPRVSSLERALNVQSLTIDTKIEQHMQVHIQQLQDANQHLKHDTHDSAQMQKLLSKQDKFQRRLTRLKDGTKSMFQQTESDYDLLNDRLHRLETDFKQFHASMPKRSIPKKLSYIPSSESDSSSFSKPAFPKQTYKYEQNATPDKAYRDTNYYRGPNMDYLRKNVNITCSTQEQILEFYIKLRLAISKGGIHIIKIEDITKDKSIAHRMNNMTMDDLQTQSNALFTLLSNENVIPKAFTMAQNCILGYASTMDGFGALKAMLKLTHPLLSRKRPPNVPPILSNSTDIHSYEQSLRNFYLLQKLYNDTDYPSIEKSKQFLQGMDDDRYADAVARVQHQLDTVETLNVDLHEDYTIDNIASTIINITGEYDNSKTIVHTMQQNDFSPKHTSNDKRTFYRSHDQSKPFSPRRPHNRRFMKTQCHACKQFGHGITQCTLLPKVLAILQFQRRNSDKCNQVLKQHIMNNTVNSKRAFVRTLMNMDIIPQDEDSDAYLHNDIIVNAIVDNDVNDEDVQSHSE